MAQSGYLALQRDYITQLFQELTTAYADLKTEISHIASHYPAPEDEFSFLEELELVVMSICGYVKQVQSSMTVKRLDDAIAHLQSLQVFAIPVIAQFYRTESDRYPKMKRYLQLLDYLRLLTLEYLQAPKAEQPIPA
ncbi:MAG: hypothetical protein AAGD25_03285 [Cyanobacteria bacterium P01_F01_bin.150]